MNEVVAQGGGISEYNQKNLINTPSLEFLLGHSHHDIDPKNADAARFALYSQLLGLFVDSSKQYGKRMRKNNERITFQKDDYDVQALTALEDLYLARNDGPESVKKFKNEWGEEFFQYERMLDSLNPQIELSKEKALASVEKWSPRTTLDTALLAGSVFTSVTEEQRIRMLLMAGYPPEDVNSLLIRLGISTGLSLGLAWGYETAGVAAAGYGMVNPFIEGLPNPYEILQGELPSLKTIGAVAGAYALYWGSMLASAESNLKLLQNKSIRTSAAITGTLSYLIFDKLLPEEAIIQSWREKFENVETRNPITKKTAQQTSKLLSSRENVRDMLTRAGILMLEPSKELAWAATVLIPHVGASMIISANLVGTALNLTQAMISAGAIAYERLNTKMKKEKINDSGVS